MPASAVALAHVDRNPDPGLHAELAAAGAYLGYDGWARSQRWPDSVLLDCLLRAAEQGAGERLLLGGDVARADAVPRLRRDAGPGLPGGARAAAAGARGLAGAGGRVLETNPARWLSGRTERREERRP